VTAVGGTSLYVNTDYTYNSESAWNGAGSGCSAYEAKPSFQHDASCTRRTVADVSADADPNTGAGVYITASGYSGCTNSGAPAWRPPWWQRFLRWEVVLGPLLETRCLCQS